MADPERTTAVTVRSIGCRTNQEEMVALASALSEEGFRMVDAPGEADIIIVNTCSVTAATEAKTRRYLKHLAQSAPRAKICVTGCLAQQDAVTLSEMPGVTWVVGNRRKADIARLLRTSGGGIHSGALDDARNELLAIAASIPPPDTPGMKRTRFSVKIQEGCDFRCSYCIVPQLRGPSRSATVEAVVETCRRAVAAGYKELILTGTHIGQFNDRQGGGLSGLLERLLTISGDYRIRLSSLDPRDCTDELLGYVGTSKKVCDHIHVSLQSLSPLILTAMHRPVEQTMDCLERLVAFRKRYPLIGIGADLIVGFPGETTRQFSETLRSVEALELSYAHVFRFSPRPETAAASMTPVVSEQEKNVRSELVRSVVQESRMHFLKKNEPVPQRIIVESVFPVRGVTSNYLHVELPGGEVPHNSWMEVSIRAEVLRGRYCPAQPVLSKVA